MLHFCFDYAAIVAHSAMELNEIRLPHTYILCSFALFVYPFFTLDSHLQKSGVEDLPLENNLPSPYKPFLDTAMDIFLKALSPELARLILETEYDIFLSNKEITHEEVLGLQIIKELVWHIYYDDYYGYLLSIENIWGNAAIEYASLTFYPNLPEEVKCKYHINELIEHIPSHMFQLDNY